MVSGVQKQIGRNADMAEEINYGFRREVEMSFSEAVGRIRLELQKEGFGVLTEIDVKETLKRKLDVDFDEYVILGACNPPFAFKALQVERDMGLMLPCNVVVYVQGGRTFIASISPTTQMRKTGNDALGEVAAEVESKLRRVIENV